jgi:hypothetical protein
MEMETIMESFRQMKTCFLMKKLFGFRLLQGFEPILSRLHA